MKKFLILLTAICMMAMFAVGTAVCGNEFFFDWSQIDTLTNGAEKPEAYVTRSELDAIVNRLSAIYTGGTPSTTAGYDKTVVTRGEVVKALYDAANNYADLTQINEVLEIVDVRENTLEYHDAAYAFTRAGIITGYDEYARFGADKNVKRYEIALMVDRILNPAERVKKDYILYASDEPYYLIDDFLMAFGPHGKNYDSGSGWRVDYTGSGEPGNKNLYGNVLTDYLDTDTMSMSRKIQVQDRGYISFEAVYTMKIGNKLSFNFNNVNGETVLSAGFNGTAFVGATISDVAIPKSKVVRMLVNIDLDNAVADMYIGNSFVGSTAIVSDSNLAEVVIDTGVDAVTVAEITNVHMYKNYVVNDMFRMGDVGSVSTTYLTDGSGKSVTTVTAGSAPLGYTVTGDVKVSAIYSNANNTGDIYSVKIAGAGSAKKSFRSLGGDVVLQAYILPDSNTGAYFAVKSADTDIIKIEAKNGSWYVGETNLGAFKTNVWQWLRIEANTLNKTYKVKINGKYVGGANDWTGATYSYTTKIKGFDGVEIGAAEGTETWFDDVEIYETHTYDDYPSAPVPLDTGDYTLSMSICNLWRNGSHYGWEWIAPYDELVPITGFYDEGIPETMDWEIKFLVEHGITNYALCWYPLAENVNVCENVPLKKPRMSDALHDGYFNAKYSDMMTFNLMYENSGHGSADYSDELNAQALANFKENVFPFWMEWYFKDDRYLKIDGNYMLTIYQYGNWVAMAGGTNEDSVNLIQWMNDQLAAEGLTGKFIINFGGSYVNGDAYTNYAAAGADNVILYAWGSNIAPFYNEQTARATESQTYANDAGVNLIALPAAGFNDIAWDDNRTGMLTAAEFQNIVQWYKDTYMPLNTTSLAQKFIQFDTWNEYGEGHYFYPTVAKAVGHPGESYDEYQFLDAIAEVFGGGCVADDVTPTDKQKIRIGHMYQASVNDHILSRDLTVAEEQPDLEHIGGYDYTDEANERNFYGYSNFEVVESTGWLFNKKNYYSMYDSTEKAAYLKTSTDVAVLNVTNGTSIAADSVDFIHIKLKSSANGRGTFFFKTDLTEAENLDGYGGFHHSWSYTYTLSAGEYIDLYIPTSTFGDRWSGNITGLRLDPCYTAGAELYIKNIELVAGTKASLKSSVIIDGQTYQTRDFNEIRTPGEDQVMGAEIHIAPQHIQGLYKMLHMVYNWNDKDGILTLEAPDGTTIVYTVGSSTAVVNGGNVALEQAITLYDGVPVIPLFFTLEQGGLDYVYDYTNKKVDIVVAQTYRTNGMAIENYNAENTSNVNFTAAWAATGTVTNDTDPTDSTNRVWHFPGTDAVGWNNIEAPFAFEAGRTYTVDFDVYLKGFGINGATAATSVPLAFVARDASNNAENGFGTITTVNNGEWSHVTYQFTIPEDFNVGTNPRLGVYFDPQNSKSADFYVDNFKVRTNGKNLAITYGDAENATGPDETNKTTWYCGQTSYSIVSVETEANGNKYWQSKCTDTSEKRWTYIRHNVEFESGVTYYIKGKFRIGTEADGSSVTTAIVANARFYHPATTSLDHTMVLHDAEGGRVSFTSGGDWVECYAELTVPTGYDAESDTTPASLCFYVDPVNYGGTFMMDDLVVSTTPFN